MSRSMMMFVCIHRHMISNCAQTERESARVTLTRVVHEETSRYRGNVPAVSEEELQTVRVGGLDGLTDIYQPHLQHTHTIMRNTMWWIRESHQLFVQGTKECLKNMYEHMTQYKSDGEERKHWKEKGKQ